MEQLNGSNEKIIKQFSLQLFGVETVDDMFPPDNNSGDREPRRPITPILTGGKALDLRQLGVLTDA